MSDRPLIGVTGPGNGGFMAWFMTAATLKRCGARVVRITPGKPFDATQLNGIVIGGGSDVEPSHYGEEPLEELIVKSTARNIIDWLTSLVLTVFRKVFALKSAQNYDPERDALERHLIQHALYYDVPVLGICRGAQLMNVALGGSLHQRIEHFYTESPNVRSILPNKKISVVAGSRLERLLNTTSCTVNALHDQSINMLGDDVHISAQESNGVIQAIEKGSHSFFIGVQWHPEYMPQSQIQRRLFQKFVECAREYKVEL